mgnify:CR=1 FL=1
MSADIAERPAERAPRDLPEDSFATYDPQRWGSSEIGTLSTPRSVATGADRASVALSRWRVSVGGDTAPCDAPLDYRLRQVVGRGGFGEVWEAEQRSLGRVVALKRLRPDLAAKGAEDPDKLAELEHGFRLEGRAIASLDHPNIVPIHDMGLDEDGHPLLAMKLVRGATWSDKIRSDSQDLSPAEFLARHLPILVAVGQAVAFAHSKGIIHRDLKPSQVIVGEFGEVTLMDWGLAVMVGEKPATDGSVAPTLAEASSPAGTVAYMAPEQTEPDARRIGAWTDVYLLGGILYNLLTLSTPHTGGSVQAFLQATRGKYVAVREAAPGRDVPAELEALVTRALQPAPEDRVPSAAAFVAALSDYLTGANRRREAAQQLEFVRASLNERERSYHALGRALERLAEVLRLDPDNAAAAALHRTVAADLAEAALRNGDLTLARAQAERLPDCGERASLLGRIEQAEAAHASRERQRRVALAGVAAAVVALLALGGVYAFQMRAKNAEIQRQFEAAEQARQVAETERSRADDYAAITLDRARATGQLTNYMVRDLRGSLDMTTERDRDLARRFAAEIAEHYLAVDIARDSDEVALEILEDMGQAAAALVGFRSMDEAELLIDRLDAHIAERFPANARLRSSTLRLRGEMLCCQEKPVEAMPIYEEALAVAQAGPGVPLKDVMLIEAALLANALQLGVDSSVREKLADLVHRIEEFAPDDIAFLHSTKLELARADIFTGKGSEAEQVLLELLETTEAGPESLRVALLAGTVASSRIEARQWNEAEPFLLRSLEITERRLGPGSPSAALLRGTLGSLRGRQGRFDEAEQLLLDAIDTTLRHFGPRHPQHAIALSNLASVYMAQRRTAEAASLLEAAIAIREDDPGTPPDALARSYGNIAGIHAQLGDREKAASCFARALALYETGGAIDNASSHASLLANLGAFNIEGGDLEKAEEYLARSIALNTQAYGEGHPSTAMAWRNLAPLYLRQGRHEEALDAAREAARLIEKSQGRQSPTWAGARQLVADASERLGDHQAALDGYLEVVAFYDDLSAKDPGNPEWPRRLADALRNAAHSACVLHQPADAAALLDRVATLDLVPRDPEDTTGPAIDAAGDTALRGAIAALQGRTAEARARWDEALAALAAIEPEGDGQARAIARIRGEMLLYLGRDSDALHAMAPVAESEPTLVPTLRARAEALRAGFAP